MFNDLSLNKLANHKIPWPFFYFYLLELRLCISKAEFIGFLLLRKSSGLFFAFFEFFLKWQSLYCCSDCYSVMMLSSF